MSTRRTLPIGRRQGTESQLSVPHSEPSPRDRFAAMLAELRRVKPEYFGMGDIAAEPLHPMTTELLAAFAQAAHASGFIPISLRGRKKKSMPTVEEIGAAIRISRDAIGVTEAQKEAIVNAGKLVRERWEPYRLGLLFRKKELEADLDLLSGSVEVRPGPEPKLLHTVGSHSYSSQTGPDWYAKKDAELKRLIASSLGTRVEVQRVPKLDEQGCERVSKWGYSAPADYRVVAWVESELDLEVLRRLTIPLREQVRLAWKLGINPRVINPFLPHGYEERVGIDHFGNDLRNLRKVQAGETKVG